MRQWCKVGNLTIANGAADSDVLHSKNCRQAVALMFITGALTNAVNIRISMDADSDVTPSSDAYIGTTSITVPASKTTVWPDAPGFGSIMAHSAGNEGAARTIEVWALIDAGT